jgi:hypothetical protein
MEELGLGGQGWAADDTMRWRGRRVRVIQIDGGGGASGPRSGGRGWRVGPDRGCGLSTKEE